MIERSVLTAARSESTASFSHVEITGAFDYAFSYRKKYVKLVAGKKI